MHALPALLSLVILIWVPVSAYLIRRLLNARRSSDAALKLGRTQMQVELFRAARRDTLTALPSRQVFIDGLAAMLADARPVALLLVDIDRFAAANSSFGEAIGDEILRTIADRLGQCGAGRDDAARLAGNEFALLINDPQQLDQVSATIGRVLRSLTASCAVAGQLLDINASIGVAIAPAHGQTAELLLRAARLALRQAKLAGGNRWQLSAPKAVRAVALHQHARHTLQRAIEAGHIIPWYQPVVRLATGQIAKVEVLARWNHAERGILMPDQFIPLADRLGLSGQISMALFRQVAADSAAWPPDCRFAFTVSAGQVRALIGLLNAAPGDWQRRMDYSRLDIDITEAALMRDTAMARELIDTLHEHGARAGLHDFGTGNSNVSLLRDMPFDSITIGEMFIKTMLADIRAEACVLSMLWLGQGLGIEMVAAGVETEATMERLAELGCPLAQGFHFSRPVPAGEVVWNTETAIGRPRKATVEYSC